MSARSKAQAPCPNEANHVPHPADYISHSNWADDAMLVADQQQCPGCNRWDLWVPKRPDLRIAVDWPPGTCDWGGCDGEAVAERFWPEVKVATSGEVRPGQWLPVCRTHTGVKPRRQSPGRAPCYGCGKEYAVTTAGVVRAHDLGWNRCVGSGRVPADAEGRAA